MPFTIYDLRLAIAATRTPKICQKRKIFPGQWKDEVRGLTSDLILAFFALYFNLSQSVIFNMKIVRGFFLCSIMLFLVSCTTVLPPLLSFARFSTPINQSFQFSTNATVVYGCFSLNHDFAWGNHLALRLRNENSKKEYLIEFQDTNSVYGIAVEPGKYTLRGFLGTFQDHRPVGRRTFFDAIPFKVRTNSATYIGDFAGYVKTSGQTEEWGITSVTNNFKSTTDDFLKDNPELAPYPVFSAFETNK